LDFELSNVKAIALLKTIQLLLNDDNVPELNKYLNKTISNHILQKVSILPKIFALRMSSGKCLP